MTRLRAIPAPVRLVFCVALAAASAWALLTPAFQVPDEPGHFAYAQYLAQTGKLPKADRKPYSREQEAVMRRLGVVRIIGDPVERVPVGGGLGDSGERARGDGGGPTGASSQPPLYYMSASVPYWLTAWAPLTTRLLAMRLFSALLFALTAALVASIAIEVLPRHPFAPVVAGLTIALSPAMGQIAGGVTPDNLMNLLAAGLVLLALRGMAAPSVRAAVLVGAVAGVGAVTKLTFAALLPGAAGVVLAIAWRLHKDHGRREAGRALLGAAAAALALPLAFAAWAHLSGRGFVGDSRSTATLPPDQIRLSFLREQLSYTWQLYLQRMPWMTAQFGHDFSLQDTWLHGYLGRYGWLDYGAPGWLLAVGRDIVLGLVALLLVALVRARAAVRARLVELGALALLPLGLAFVIGSAGYEYRNNTGFAFEQVRYLFPVGSLVAVAVAVACLGVGRRWAPVAGAVVIGLLCLHELSGLMLTAARYYG